MKSIFLDVVNMSITASWVTLIVLLLRLIFKKAPKWITVILWGVVGIRLISPFSFESIYSLIPSAKTIYTDVYVTRPYIETGFSGVDRVINDDFVGIAGVTVRHDYYAILHSVLSIAWIIGIIAMLCYAIISFKRVQKKVSASINSQDNIFLCDDIDTPFILGIIKPKIYLPSSLNEETKEYVIAHEKAHLKRCDHLWKPLGFALLCLHWFNPVLWLAYIFLCRDIESACDEAVLKKLGSDAKSEYSKALLSCSARQKIITVCPLTFGEVGLKARIKSVLNYKKCTFWVILFAVIISIIASACLLTDPTYKLSDLDLEYAFDNAQSIEQLLGDSHAFTEDTKKITWICSVLKKVKITKNPISYNRSEDRDKSNTITINENISVHFNSDFSEVWVDNGVKPSLTHAVKNPELLIKSFTSGVIDNSGSELAGVSIQITELNLTDEKPYITVTFTRMLKENIFYGDAFNLYYFENGKWVDTAVAERVFNTLAYMPTDSTRTFTHEYPLSLHDLSKQGRYKFETTVHKKNDSKEYKLWAEFELKDGYETSTVRTFSPSTCYYESGLYDPAYPPKDRSFKFINDNMLFEFSRGDNYWKPLGNVSEYTLTKENFDYIFELKWQTLKWSPKALRKSAKKVYKIDPQEENWYYILVEGEDGFYLGEFTKLGCMWFYSLDDVNVNPSFTATILEISEQTILVSPSEDSAEAKSYDKILVNADILTTKLDAAFKVGDNIRIVYNGIVLESYPPVINTIFNITKTE